MLRRLTLSLVVLATTAVALASSAAASVVDPGGSGLTPAPATSPSGFPWGDVALGVAVAILVGACLVGARFLARNHTRVAASH